MQPLFPRIFISVAFAHIIAILLCIFQPLFLDKTPPKKIGQKVVVQTVHLNPANSSNAVSTDRLSETKIEQNQIAMAQPKKEEPLSSPTPPPSSTVLKSSPEPNIKPKIDSKPVSENKLTLKESPKVVPKTSPKSVTQTITPKPPLKTEKSKSAINTKKATSTMSEPVSKKAETSQKNDKREKLLAQARESINKIQKGTHTASKSSIKADSKTSVEAPNLIEELESDSFNLLGFASNGASPESIYGSELINRLKLLLHLPEHGDVDIELVLAKSGKVLSVKIIRDESRNNRMYIEKTVPTLTLPPFGSYFEGESQHTFVVRLTNR